MDALIPRCNGIDIDDASVASLTSCMAKGTLSSVDLIQYYLQRIDSINHRFEVS